jgi:hypothetical protein
VDLLKKSSRPAERAERARTNLAIRQDGGKRPSGRAVAVAAALLLANAAPAAAVGFKVPPGFVVSHDAEATASKDWRPLLTVRPEDNPFSELTSIELREVTGTVKDPDAWLKERLTVDVGDEAKAKEIVDSPDSPFGDPAFDVLRQLIPQLFESLKTLGEIPAQMCNAPQTAYNASGPLRELYCAFQFGPLRQYLVLRLQHVGSKWYYTEIRTANERRLRELLAIADTFSA